MEQMTAAPYEVLIAQDWNSYTIYFSGEVDYAAVMELSPKLDEVAKICEHELVFDLGDVTFIDSEGMKLLIKAYRDMRDRNGKLVISRCSKRALRSIRLAGLDQIFEIADEYKACI